MNDENLRIKRAKKFLRKLAKIQISDNFTGYDFSGFEAPYFIFTDKEKFSDREHSYECNAFFISKENVNKLIMDDNSSEWDYWDYVAILDVDKNEIIKWNEEIA